MTAKLTSAENYGGAHTARKMLGFNGDLIDDTDEGNEATGLRSPTFAREARNHLRYFVIRQVYGP